MYRTILVPLDGSERAEAILPHVENLAKRYDAKIILLQVIEPIPLGVGIHGAYMILQEEMELRAQQAETYLRALQDILQKQELKVETCMTHGAAVEAIIRIAEEEKVDLIAMASHGRTGLSRVFYGSVAVGVLHRVNRPLLLVRSRDDD